MSLSETKRILLSGNTPLVQTLLLRAFAALPVQLEITESSAECLAWVKARNYDLVITDVHSSVADDLQLLKQIREIRPEIKVIVLAEASTAEDVIEAIREHAFSLFCPPFDAENITKLIAQALELNNWEDGIEVLSARPEWISLRVRCQQVTAERLLQFMRELRTDLPAEERHNIGIAFREMLLNAIEYGAGFDPDKTVEVCYVRTARVLIYQIRDPGEGFSFAKLPHAAITNPSHDPTQHVLYRHEHGLRSGGFGIMIVRNLVDELFYNDKGNEVLMLKYL